MKEGKNKPVKWHLSLGPSNPRIGLHKLQVADVITQKYNQVILLRAKDLKARDIPVYIDHKDYELLVMDIKKAVSSKDFKDVPIYLYGNGMRIVVFRSEKHKPKDTPPEEEKKVDIPMGS